MSMKGYPSSEKLESSSQEFATVQKIGAYKHGMDVIANVYAALVTADAVEASSTAYIINATAHSAKKGMIIKMTSGSTSGEYASVARVTTNAIYLDQPLSAAPSAADTFEILRWIIPEASGTSGAITVALSTAARSKVLNYRNDYSSAPVTTAAYTQITAATSGDIYTLNIFDSSGYSLILAVGGAGVESPILYIPPGGFPAPVDIYIAAGSRLSMKALSTNLSSGEIVINATN